MCFYHSEVSLIGTTDTRGMSLFYKNEASKTLSQT